MPRLAPSEVLRQVMVRPIVPTERVRWDALMRAHHYLGLQALVGHSLRYVAVVGNAWLALLGWQAAALKCMARDQWIGWPPVLQYQRLPLIANNARFLILPDVRVPNLASRVLSLTLKRLSQDWQAVHGHPVVLAETFVNRACYTGACYRAANWKVVGMTRGFGKTHACYWRHEAPKEVLLYPLHPRARTWLCDPKPHPQWRTPMHALTLSTKQMEDLHQRLRQLPDCRKPLGLRHPFASVLSMALAAVLAGSRGYTAIAEWVERLTQSQLKRLRARFNPKTQRFEPPSEPTLRRVLQAADAQAVDQAFGEWMMRMTPADEPIAVDGKTLCGARRKNGTQVHLLSALLQSSGATLASHEVPQKTNEIPEIKTLLKSLDLQGRLITVDALHTQTDTARYLVEEKGADYLFTVKDNQPTLHEHLKALREEDFSPGAHHPGKSPRTG